MEDTFRGWERNETLSGVRPCEHRLRPLKCTDGDPLCSARARPVIIRIDSIDQNGEGEGLWFGIPRKMSPSGDFFLPHRKYGDILWWKSNDLCA
jgi:hypothetical protein